MAVRGVQQLKAVTSQHEGFLRHAGFRWLKVALTISLLAIVIYAFDDVQPRPNGGSAACRRISVSSR